MQYLQSKWESLIFAKKTAHELKNTTLMQGLGMRLFCFVALIATYIGASAHNFEIDGIFYILLVLNKYVVFDK